MTEAKSERKRQVYAEVEVPELLEVGADDLIGVDVDDLLDVDREEHVEEQDLVPETERVS